ncbi:Hsp70 family protein, partial [Stenotrophomonas sp. FR010]
TNKEQKVEIKAGSGLSEEEIARMVGDAEKHRDDDLKFQGLVGARNQADALVYTVRNAVREHGSKVGGEVIGEVEAALSSVELAMKGEDRSQIESKTQALERIAAPLLSAATSQEQPQAGGSGPEHGAGGGDDVVDADFTEVKDK